MNIRRRNWLHETRNEEINRRLRAVESHIGDLEERYRDLENRFNMLAEMVRAAFRGESAVIVDEIEIRADDSNLPEPNMYHADNPNVYPNTYNPLHNERYAPDDSIGWDRETHKGDV